MVLDKLSQWKTYESLSPYFKAAFEFLEGARTLANGRYELGGGMYANVSDTTTRDPATYSFEAHKRFIDIQYIIGGKAVMGWAHTADLKPNMEYDEKNDYVLLDGEGNNCIVKDDDFYILWPDDAHKPHGMIDKPETFKVVVVKVPVK